MYIERQLEKLFLETSASFKAVLLTGPRQAGKTSMLKHLQKTTGARTYVSMDDDTQRRIAKEDPTLFFQMFKPPIIIDEVQKAPELFEQIKLICDESDTTGLFWLTGSQKFGLLKKASETLTGRVAILNLYGLSSDEKNSLISDNDIDFSYDSLLAYCNKRPAVDITETYERIFKGGYPAVLDMTSRMRKIYYDSYIDTYLMRDILEDTGIKDVYKFKKFLTACASINSNLVNYATLADAASISQPTAKTWLGILEALGIIFLLDVYSNNLLTSTIKTPKLYFWDTGLCAYLCGWDNAQTLCNGASSGAFLENYVISELIKGCVYRGSQSKFYYYRDKTGKEIDLIIEKNQTITPIEIKRTASPNKSMASSFSSIKVISPYSKGTGAIICSQNKVLMLSQDILSVPLAVI